MRNKKDYHPVFANVPLEPIFRSQRIFPMAFNQSASELIASTNYHYQCIIETKLVSVIDLKSSTRILRTLIDTGSYYSFVNRNLVIMDHVKDTGRIAKFSPLNNDAKSEIIYSSNILIPALGNEAVFEFPFAIQDALFSSVDVVMGTDFLRNFTFKYNYPKDGEFCLKFNPFMPSS